MNGRSKNEPEEVDRSLFGQRIRIRATGYASDGKNEGLRVELFTNDPELARMAAEIAVPHITIAVGEDGRSVDTKDLAFRDIEPIELFGKFGGYTRSGFVCTRRKKKKSKE